MMSTTGQQPATTPIPVQLSEPEFEAFLFPHLSAISGDLLSAVISIRCILGFRKDNPNVFNMLVQNLPITSGIKCICC